MSKIGIFMADGCEEIEGLTVVDVVRRTKMEIVMLSITGKKEVTSSHGVTFLADALAEETGYEDLDGIVLPGGMPGTMHLLENETVNAVIRKFAEEGKLVAAICAASECVRRSRPVRRETRNLSSGLRGKINRCDDQRG